MLFKILFFSILIYFAIKAVLNLLAAVVKDGHSSAGHIGAYRTIEDDTFSVYNSPPRSYAPRTSSSMVEDIEDAKWQDVT
jgi:hypothetical protein